MRPDAKGPLRIAAALLVATLSFAAVAGDAPSRMKLPDLTWPAQSDTPVDPAWISEHSTGLAGEYARDFASAVLFKSETVARYQDTYDAPTPARGVLMRVLVGADGKAQGFRIFRSSGDPDYDELVMQSVYADKPLLAPPTALLQGRPTLYVIGMFALGYAQNVDRQGPIYARAIMALDGKQPGPPRPEAGRANALAAVTRDFEARPPLTDRLVDIELRFVRGARRISAVEIFKSSGDAALDDGLRARALAAVAPFALPEKSFEPDWIVHYRFEPRTAAPSAPH